MGGSPMTTATPLPAPPRAAADPGIRFSIFLLELTSHCNMCCDFCPDGIMKRPRGLMDAGLAKKVMRELAGKRMCERVFFHVMGEPLLHPRFDELARHAHECGLKLSLYTNSSLLTEKHIERLLSVPIDNLTLSIQSIDQDSFVLRRAGRLSYGNYVGGVERFLRMKVERRHPGKVTMHYMVGNVKPGSPGGLLIVSKEQAEGVIRKWQAFFRGLDPEGAARAAAPPVSLADVERDYPVYPGVVLFLKAAHHWAGAMVQVGYEFRPSESGYCAAISGGAAAGTFAVLWNGAVTYCCNDYEGTLALGNANEQTIEEIYAGPKAAAIRENAARGRLIHPTCQRCMGRLVRIDTGKKVPKYNNPLTLLHLSSNYYKKHGLRQTVRKSLDYLRKSF